MKKRVSLIVISVILILQTIGFANVYASQDTISFDLATIVENGVVHRGSMEYGQFDSQNVIVVIPGYSSRQSGTTVVLDYVIPEYINASEYAYASFEYYKTDEGHSVKFRPALDGKMTNILHDAVSDCWHRVVFKIAPDENVEKRFNQFHFMPFDAQDANSISEERCYIKSISVHKNNPITQEEIAFNEKIKEDILKKNEYLKIPNEDVSVFEDLDKMKKTPEIVLDPSFEENSNVWVKAESNITFVTERPYDGQYAAKVTERTNSSSGIQQDITDALNKYGPGDYRVSAFIRNDETSTNTFKDYKLSVVIDGKEASYCTFHINNDWQKINGAFRLEWSGDVSNALIKVCGVDEQDTEDFYVDNVCMVKCLYNEEKSSHTAYIKGSDDGKFLPEDNITRAEAVAIVSRLMADEETFKGLNTSNYKDVSKSEWYYDNVAYMESSGLLSYFENNFEPEKAITRAEFVYLVNNVSKLVGEKEITFTDVNDSHKLYEDIIKAINAGMIEGYEDKTFRPDASITRVEAVTIVNRATKRFPVAVSYSMAMTAQFSDIDETHWAYDQVIEASTSHNATVIDKGDRFVEAWEINESNYDKDLAQKIEDEVNVNAENLKSEIINAEDKLEITGTKYYVSNNGNDENSGLTPQDAWKTIDKVNAFKEYKNGDAILFERGGIWRGATVLCKSGLTYAAYGEGEKPKLYGSERDYADPDFWVKTDTPNVWTTTENFSNVGFLQFDGTQMSQKVFSAEELNKNLNFMQEKYNGVPILLYFDGGNPGEVFESIEIAPEYSIFIADNKHDIRIDNICMKYTGWHGVKFANVENISVTNCEVGWIGGTGGSPTSSKTRWGNGIEFWESCNNILVDHCYVYQIYDAAVTNQWKGDAGTVVVEENVTYTNNLIENATYSYEFFMNQYNSNSAIMKNITFADNICRYAGKGWGQDNRPNKDTSADIKGWHSINRTENFVVKNNIFQDALLLNVDFASYSRNLAADTKGVKNKFPQYLIKLENNTYIGESGRRFVTYNCFDYNNDFNSNYNFVKDNIDYGAKIIFK